MAFDLALKTAAVFLIASCVPALAQDGHHGVGHDKWHAGFYSKLMRKDGKGSCCNLIDCSPTQSRMADDHYEVKVEGVWTRIDQSVIQNVSAPDGGAHVCAPKQQGANKGVVYCVVLPPEG
jgi:hypothetical protein